MGVEEILVSEMQRVREIFHVASIFWNLAEEISRVGMANACLDAHPMAELGGNLVLVMDDENCVRKPCLKIDLQMVMVIVDVSK